MRANEPELIPDLQRRRLVTWLWRVPVVAALAGGVYGLYRAAGHLRKPQPEPNPTFVDVTPAEVAPLESFGKVWETVLFSAGGVPAIALRLPEPVPGSLTFDGRSYLALSRICTHQGCVVSFNTNPEAVAVASNYRPETPVLFCPCHLSVFLPAEAGRAVSGPAVRPLPRFRLEPTNGILTATGLETSTHEEQSSG